MMQPQYGMPGFYGPPPRPTNGMAIGSLVCSLLSLVTCAVTAPVGVILGHIALSQIKRDQSEGKGLAIAGLVIGYLFTIALVLGIVLLIVGANQNNS
jgi:peptidyl-prolyl cis-trans isomerase B (cyclophilin B)